MVVRVLAAAMLVVMAAGPAAAQFRRALPQTGDVPCVLDKCLDATSPAPAPPAPASPPFGARRAPISPGNFDFYVLALSWSPGFCATGGTDKSPAQCAPGRGLGFVVHGLWPQNQQGYPSRCDGGARFPSRMALDSVRDLYPDEGLARHEWRQHGTCSGLGPADYFTAVRQARDAITVPADFTAADGPRTLTPRDIARAFMASNRGLRIDTMAVTCRAGALAEVRLCFTKDLRGYVSCPEVVRDGCRAGRLTVPPAR